MLLPGSTGRIRCSHAQSPPPACHPARFPIGFSRMSRLVLFNKPYDVLSQFTDGEQRQTLKDYIDLGGVYPAGRLDRDSEGLLLLTDDGKLQQAISDPGFKLEKTYLVQVEGAIESALGESALNILRNGVNLNDGPTLPARAEAIAAPQLWERNPPIRVRLSIPDSWLALSIREGRNRQVRRMTAATGFPTLRLIRIRIGPWELGTLQPGEYRVLDIDSEEFVRSLKTPARPVGKRPPR